MKRSRRPDSPLMSKLRELDMGGLRASDEVPEKIRTREETSSLAFCPLLVKYVGRGMCGDVDCRNCKLPYAEYDDVETGWFCTTCARENVCVLPYYGNGRCTGCGRESCILMLCEVLD